jgi:hypothetical protein
MKVEPNITQWFMSEFTLRNYSYNDEELRQTVLSHLGQADVRRWQMKSDLYRAFRTYEQVYFAPVGPKRIS